MSQRTTQKSNRWTCRRKTRFLSESQAAIAGDSIGLRFYRCACCGAFHLTSKKTWH